MYYLHSEKKKEKKKGKQRIVPALSLRWVTILPSPTMMYHLLALQMIFKFSLFIEKEIIKLIEKIKEMIETQINKNKKTTSQISTGS